MSAPPPVLVARGLARRFDARAVVESLELMVQAGERVAFRGANGSGKTTALRCLAGTLALSAGGAEVRGAAVGTIAARRYTGLSLSQDRAFYLRLSGRENLLFFARVRGHGRRASTRILDALAEELELHDILRQRADRCSTGMLQQLAFARALIGDPPLLLLDEPTRSLDSAAVDRLWSALERRPAAAAIIATHLDEDRRRCDRTIDFPC